MRQLDRLLADRFSEPWTLTALAARLAVHPHHLSRAVRRHRRTSVGAWLRRLRVEYAAQLLRTALPLAEVALRAGFCDQSHLSRCFSRHFGTTPRAWRRDSHEPG
jgi:AraC family transcriptional regulator